MTSGGCVVAQPHYRINLITLLWWRPDQLSIGANQSQHRPVLRKVAHRPCAARMTSVNAPGRAKEPIRGDCQLVQCREREEKWSILQNPPKV
jgi:hypothetical protein